MLRSTKNCQLCTFSCVYQEYVINISGVKKAIFVNFRVYILHFKSSQINGGRRRGCYCSHGTAFCLKNSKAIAATGTE